MPASLQEELESLLQFLYIAPIGLVQTRLDGEILMANPLSAQLLLPLARDGALRNLYTALADVAPDLRTRVQAHDGSYGMVCEGLHLQVSAAAARHPRGQVLSLSLLRLDQEQLMAVISDVTQSVRRELELRQSQAWIHGLFTAQNDYGLLSLDERGRMWNWHAGVERITGHREAATVGVSYTMLYPPDNRSADKAIERLREADECGWSHDEGWMLRADGTMFWGSSLIAPLHDPDESRPADRAYGLVIRDVSTQHEAAEALRRSAAYDQLTGLANRSAFFEAAGRELQRWRRLPKPLSVVLFEVDGLREINAAHGLAAGDAVLRHLAGALSASFRGRDTVARLGSEQFVVLLPGTPADEATVAAERLCRHAGGQTVTVDGLALRCSVSAGIAGMADSVDGLDALLGHASQAFAAAKSAGGQRVAGWPPARAAEPGRDPASPSPAG